MNNGMKHENRDGPVSMSLGCQDVCSLKGWMNEHRSFGVSTVRVQMKSSKKGEGLAKEVSDWFPGRVIVPY